MCSHAALLIAVFKKKKVLLEKISISHVLSNNSCLSSCPVSPAAVRSRLLRLRSLWDEIRQRAEEREGKLNDVLDLAGKFWADVAALLSTLKDSQDIVKELEDPGVDPSLIKQQIEAAEVREICL